MFETTNWSEWLLKKGTQIPLIRVSRHSKDVRRHEERLLVVWDEERHGKSHAEVSHVTISVGITSKIS